MTKRKNKTTDYQPSDCSFDRQSMLSVSESKKPQPIKSPARYVLINQFLRCLKGNDSIECEVYPMTPGETWDGDNYEEDD